MLMRQPEIGQFVRDKTGVRWEVVGVGVQYLRVRLPTGEEGLLKKINASEDTEDARQ